MDENHRPLMGYEPSDGRNFKNLQDAGGARSHCKERRGIHNGQLMDNRLRFNRVSEKMTACSMMHLLLFVFVLYR